MAREKIRRAKPLLGTIVEIAFSSGRQTDANKMADLAFDEISRLESLLSFFNPRSEVSRLNQQAHLNPQEVSAETLEVLQISLQLWRESSGLFDITIGDTLARSGFLPKTYRRSPFKDANSQAITINNQMVAFNYPLTIDLGGIAKGYIVDRALQLLSEYQLDDIVVNAGGDLAVRSSDGVPIYIRNPANPSEIIRQVHLKQGAVATSATYFSPEADKFLGTCALCHPTDGCTPIQERSVTIIAPNCVTADALTKIMWLDEDIGSELLSLHNSVAIVLGTKGQHAMGDNSRQAMYTALQNRSPNEMRQRL